MSELALKYKLILLTGSLLAGSILAEFALRRHLRAWPFEPDPPVLTHLSDKDRTLRWRYTAGDGRNSLGLRNREIGPKPPGTFRILFLGDSMLFFGATESGSLFTQVLEENLHQGLGRAVEVINAGVPGYTTYQELEFLKLYGLTMDPDLVILGFVFNDLHYPYEHRPGLDTVSPDPVIQRNRLDPHGLLGRVLGRSYCVQACAALLARDSYWWEQTPYCALAWKPWGWEHSEELLNEMIALLGERDIPLRLVVFPIRDQMAEDWASTDRDYILYPQSHIRAFCEERHIQYFDLTDALHRHGGTELFRDHLHLTGRGNEVVATQLSDWLTITSPLTP